MESDILTHPLYHPFSNIHIHIVTAPYPPFSRHLGFINSRYFWRKWIKNDELDILTYFIHHPLSNISIHPSTHTAAILDLKILVFCVETGSKMLNQTFPLEYLHSHIPPLCTLHYPPPLFQKILDLTVENRSKMLNHEFPRTIYRPPSQIFTFTWSPPASPHLSQLPPVVLRARDSFHACPATYLSIPPAILTRPVVTASPRGVPNRANEELRGGGGSKLHTCNDISATTYTVYGWDVRLRHI